MSLEIEQQSNALPHPQEVRQMVEPSINAEFTSHVIIPGIVTYWVESDESLISRIAARSHRIAELRLEWDQRMNFHRFIGRVLISMGFQDAEAQFTSEVLRFLSQQSEVVFDQLQITQRERVLRQKRLNVFGQVINWSDKNLNITGSSHS